jgi:cell wall-associated NlpC family hydrolase
MAEPSSDTGTDTATATAAPTAAAAPAAAAATYTVVGGDTLSKIAFAHRIDGGWPALYELNRDQLGNGPDWIDIGQVLKLAGAATAKAPAAPLTEDPAPAAAPKSSAKTQSTAKPKSGTTAKSSGTTASTGSSAKSSALTEDTSAAAPASSSKAATAIAFARAQLGKPYVYGAEGPNAYDCSGLVQAAWKAAGVSLPRVTNDQYAAGRKVSTSNLQPGDLVFYYSGISHVGMYIGNGQIIHAPNPSTVVKIASVDSMPIYGATRPA